MSRASGKNKDSLDGKHESDETVENEEDTDEIEREETPDLYRNSALGMCVYCQFLYISAVANSLFTGMVA